MVLWKNQLLQNTPARIASHLVKLFTVDYVKLVIWKNIKKLYGKTISLDIYNWEVQVLYGDIELLDIWAKRNFKNYNDDSTGKQLEAFCYIDDPDERNVPDFIYIGKTKNNYGNITHETLHFALLLLANANVYINAKYYDGHEALTYLTGYIVQEITKNTWYEYQPNKKKKWLRKF